MSKQAFVIGSAGALGQALCRSLKSQGWNIYAADVLQTANLNDIVLKQFVLSSECSTSESFRNIKSTMTMGITFDAIYCVAGGFSMGSTQDEDYLDSVEKMYNVNVRSSLLASAVANKYLSKNGLLIFTGALGALEPSPSMIGYGVSKAAVHHMAKCLAASGSGLPASSRVAVLLPRILDTPSNRAAMPKADFKGWTPLEVLSNKLVEWGGTDEIKNGDFIAVETANGETNFRKISN